MEGYILFRDGTLIRGYAMGQPGLRIGRTVRFSGGVDPHFLATDPQQRNLIIATDSPELGSLGARPLVDQSASVQAVSVLCRDMVDFPSYRTSYRNISHLYSRDGGFMVSSLNMSKILKRASEGEDAAIMAFAGKSAGPSALESMARSLKEYRHQDRWDPSAGARRTVEFKDPEKDVELLVLDLGIRSGMLRALRSLCNVTFIPPNLTNAQRSDRRFDAALISSGPGSIPSEELVEIVRAFYRSTGSAPLLAMGMGALALCTVLGSEPKPLKAPHRSMTRNVMLGEISLPTYQSHDHHPGDIEDLEASFFGNDGTPEVLSGFDVKGRSVTLSMADTLPEFGTLEGDPLIELLRTAGEDVT
ncbi:MAG: carbamoyl-phosphate synthase domain-containing protein [Candidatus Thermoplasmatota archaeon]|nr:carbamoyl-phosphate synthase domain-containing protein [Candidatus Thermoplasmatota archaeon]